MSDPRLTDLIERLLLIEDRREQISNEIRGLYREAAAKGYDKTDLGLLVRQEYVRRKNLTIYFCAFERKGLLKIGISGQLDKRLKNLSRECEDEPDLLFSCRASASEEGWYHATFHAWRVRGEWFELNDETRAMVEAVKARKSESPGRIASITRTDIDNARRTHEEAA